MLAATLQWYAAPGRGAGLGLSKVGQLGESVHAAELKVCSSSTARQAAGRTARLQSALFLMTNMR
jgi:hypothetical protein